jgi:hypothetical protein
MELQAIKLTDDAKTRLVKWYKNHTRHEYIDEKALIREIQTHSRFGEKSWFYEMSSFDSKDGTPQLYDFEANDYVYTAEVADVIDFIDTCVCDCLDMHGDTNKFESIKDLVDRYCEDVFGHTLYLTKVEWSRVYKCCNNESIRRLVK